MTYAIWSHYHKQWWKINSEGYTMDPEHTGLYPREKAADIVFQSLRNTAIPTVLAIRMINMSAEEVENEIDKLRMI